MLKKIDHVVITTAHLEECLDFYQALSFEARCSKDRYELFAGDFKINVHLLGHELSPHAKNVQTGSCDFCFEINDEISKVKESLEAKGLKIELGIVTRCGVFGEMKSIYLRDPDLNLIELCSYK